MNPLPPFHSPHVAALLGKLEEQGLVRLVGGGCECGGFCEVESRAQVRPSCKHENV